MIDPPVKPTAIQNGGRNVRVIGGQHGEQIIRSNSGGDIFAQEPKGHWKHGMSLRYIGPTGANRPRVTSSGSTDTGMTRRVEPT